MSASFRHIDGCLEAYSSSGQMDFQWPTIKFFLPIFRWDYHKTWCYLYVLKCIWITFRFANLADGLSLKDECKTIG